MGMPLNRLAPGLLDFFGIKAGGWGPRELVQVLQPQIDLTRWYLDAGALDIAPVLTGSPFAANQNQGVLAFTTSPIDLTSGGVLTVPQTEAWLILEATMSWNFTATAGQTADFGWSFASQNTGTQFLPMQLSGFTTSVAAITQGGSRSALRPYWAFGGVTIQPMQYGLVVPAGNITAGGRLRLVRFRI